MHLHMLGSATYGMQQNWYVFMFRNVAEQQKHINAGRYETTVSNGMEDPIMNVRKSHQSDEYAEKF